MFQGQRWVWKVAVACLSCLWRAGVHLLRDLPLLSSRPFPGCARGVEQPRSPVPAGGNCCGLDGRERLRGKLRWRVVVPCGSGFLSPASGLGSESAQLIFSNHSFKKSLCCFHRLKMLLPSVNSSTG